MELHGRTGTNSRGIINKPATLAGTRSHQHGLFETRDRERRPLMPRISEGEMKTMTRILTITLAFIFAPSPSNLTIGALAQDGAKERLDYAMIARIKEEGLNRSQVMDHVSWLSDVYGPRLT